MAKHSTRYDSGEFDLTYTEGQNGQPNIWAPDRIQCALLADIRRELRALNRLLNCQNFINIPKTLKVIQKNTAKRRYVRKSKAVNV